MMLEGLVDAGWRASALEKTHPFLISTEDPAGQGLVFRAFIWNCTHGGGSKRSDNEYRIQFTSAVPKAEKRYETALLGWHDGYEVFAAWDIRKHDNQVSKSPSAQVKEEALQGAHVNGFATYARQNGEIVIAFRREFLGEYLHAARRLHSGGAAARDFSILNKVGDLRPKDIDAIHNMERRWIVATIARRYRAADFRRRVLSAYGHRCAVCGLQLDLVEAAHINPVTERTSTDETANGLALCPLHHAAYDRRVISITESYNVEVSETRMATLATANRGAGAGEFRANLKPAILLPADKRDYPKKQHLRRGRVARGWNP